MTIVALTLQNQTTSNVSVKIVFHTKQWARLTDDIAELIADLDAAIARHTPPRNDVANVKHRQTHICRVMLFQ